MSRVKTGAIMLLSALAVYLTSQLWFANISTRNFFYSMLVQAEPLDSSMDRVFARPYRLITNYGGGKFGIQYGGMGAYGLRESCDEAILAMLKDGEFLGAFDLDYADVFSAPGYIYEYAFNMPPAVFASAFGKNAFQENLEYITSIVFVPSYPENAANIWLLDENAMKMVGYSVKTELGPVFVDNAGLPGEILYEPSALKKYDFPKNTSFTRNAFIAVEPEMGYRYQIVVTDNPYAENEPMINVVGARVNNFFQNPAAKLHFVSDENVYTYVDADTVVKYYQNDVLEYSNYSAGDGGGGLLGSFGAALRFIGADEKVANEYYLAGYERLSEEEDIFYFDYVINNLPLSLPNDFSRDDLQVGASPIAHAIEVTVRLGKVANYKKIVYNFSGGYMSKNADLNFEEALAEAAASKDREQGKISGVLLGYRLEYLNQKAFLYWLMRMDGSGSIAKVA